MMRQIPLGPGAPPVSAVGYGGMHLSLAGRPSEAEALGAVHAALDSGVTIVDTADVYCLDQDDIGHNERLIARALSTWAGPRDRVLVATKGGLVRPEGRWERNGRPDHLRAACEASLRALGLEQLALYQLHAPDPAVPLEESVATLAALCREGKVRAVGLSNVSVEQIRRAQAIVPVTTVQNRLSPFFREALADGVVRYCGEHGIGFLAYSPTGGARLTLRIPDHPVLRDIARRRGVSPHAVCLAWVLSQGPSVIVIPSARRADHATDSATAADLALSEPELRSITEARFDRT